MPSVRSISSRLKALDSNGGQLPCIDRGVTVYRHGALYHIRAHDGSLLAICATADVAANHVGRLRKLKKKEENGSIEGSGA